MSQKPKQTICVDFDGVIHGYTSPWRGPRKILDGPVPGALQWLLDMTAHYRVAILSSRSRYFLGRHAIKKWLAKNYLKELAGGEAWVAQDHIDFACSRGLSIDDPAEAEHRWAKHVVNSFWFPKHKPPALIYLDDRAMRFAGFFPEVADIEEATPWNKPDVLTIEILEQYHEEMKKHAIVPENGYINLQEGE